MTLVGRLDSVQSRLKQLYDASLFSSLPFHYGQSVDGRFRRRRCKSQGELVADL